MYTYTSLYYLGSGHCGECVSPVSLTTTPPSPDPSPFNCVATAQASDETQQEGPPVCKSKCRDCHANARKTVYMYFMIRMRRIQIHADCKPTGEHTQQSVCVDMIQLNAYKFTHCTKLGMRLPGQDQYKDRFGFWRMSGRTIVDQWFFQLLFKRL